MVRRRSLLLAAIAVPARAQSGPLTVFAAASLTDAMRAITQAWEAAGHPAVRLVVAASSTLARQIEQGAPADLFLSADEPWMDYLQQRNLIQDATRTSPLGNRLVLIAPADRPGVVDLTQAAMLARLGTAGRLAVGDPSSVPAGIYAQAALRTLGLWDSLAPRLARAETVRAALLLVERGEAPLGIVYATDAAISPGVRVVADFPAGSHPPITYPFALTRRAGPDAAAFLAFATGPEAAAIYRRLGFLTHD